MDGSAIKLSQATKYPWEGRVDITIEKCKKNAFDIQLRIPGWANGTKILVNGTVADVEVLNGTYARLTRSWKKGDVITLDMPMQIKIMEANARIEQNRNQVAIQRGPVVYCVEAADLPRETNILDVYLPSSSKLIAEYKADFLGGVSVIKTELKVRKSKSEKMYHEMKQADWKNVNTQLIPYFTWSNRGQNEMSVWLPYLWE